MPDLDLTRKQRLALEADDPVLFGEVAELFARHDLLGLINMGAPRDEYVSEVGTILPRLQLLRTDGDLTVDTARRVIHQEFIQWFSPGIAGRIEKYGPPAEELVALLGQNVRTDR